MAQAAPMPMCPMAETCKGMIERPLSGLAGGAMLLMANFMRGIGARLSSAGS